LNDFIFALLWFGVLTGLGNEFAEKVPEKDWAGGKILELTCAGLKIE
jgi:hypothetical protein